MNNPKKSQLLAGLLDRFVLWKQVVKRALIKLPEANLCS